MIAHIEAQGSLLRLKLKGQQAGSKSHAHRRGIIRAFSRGSRLRLMRFMARLKVRKIRATFITLTFTEMVSHEKAKKCFKRFAMRLRRAYEHSSAIWRLEYQPKRGAIHFHLLVFNLPFWKQAALQETWEECTQEARSIVDIRLIHGAKSIMSYISKYIAKVDERVTTSLDDVTYQHEGDPPSTGRFWGYINKELLPLGQKFSGVLTNRQVIRSLSSFAWSLLGSDNPYNSTSFHLFADNAFWLCENAIDAGGCWLYEWEFTTRDHTTGHVGYSPFTEHFSEAELELNPAPTLGRLVKGERSEFTQPLISGWLVRASLVVSASV